MSSPPLVSAQWLHAHRTDPQVVVADVRWYLQGKRGIDAYLAGHIPGAHFVDLDVALAAPPGEGRPGRHPLPEAGVFATAMARLRVHPDTLVVAYDDAGGSVAARLWWLTRYFGLGRGCVLDGGIAAWTNAGFPLTNDPPTFASTGVPPVHPHPEMVVDQQRVQALVATGEALLLDARARERFEGRVEPVDKRPGHIPGARNAPFNENLVTPGGPFLPPADLARRYEALGVTPSRPLIAYCGSGVTACHTLFALALLGREDALLYEGSWSDWAANPLLPAETGSP